METNYEESYRRIMESAKSEENPLGNPLCYSDSVDIFNADVFHGQFKGGVLSTLDCFPVYNFWIPDLCGIYGLYSAGASDRTWH